MLLLEALLILRSEIKEQRMTFLSHTPLQATAISDRPKAKPTKTQGKNSRKAYQLVQQQLQQSQQQQLSQEFHPFSYSHEIPQQVFIQFFVFCANGS